MGDWGRPEASHGECVGEEGLDAIKPCASGCTPRPQPSPKQHGVASCQECASVSSAPSHHCRVDIAIVFVPGKNSFFLIITQANISNLGICSSFANSSVCDGKSIGGHVTSPDDLKWLSRRRCKDLLECPGTRWIFWPTSSRATAEATNVVDDGTSDDEPWRLHVLNEQLIEGHTECKGRKPCLW